MHREFILKAVHLLSYFHNWIVVIGILFLSIASEKLFATEPYAWKLRPGKILEVNEYHKVQFKSGNQVKPKEDKIRIVLKAEKCEQQNCILQGIFDTYTRLKESSSAYWKGETYFSKFILKKNGQYIVPDEVIMPNLRSMPSFPAERVQAGDNWQMPGSETFDYPEEKFKVKSTFTVKYEHKGKENWEYEGKTGEGEKIYYEYKSFYTAPKGVPKGPLQIEGTSKAYIYFDPVKGVPQFRRNILHYKYIQRDGSTQEADYDIYSVYSLHDEITPESKKKMAEKITGDIDKKPNPNSENKLDVRQTKEGITISIDSILFGHDQSNLKPEALAELEKVADILKKYPDREIRIGGHTDNTGSTKYNQKLSEDRAFSVWNVLKSKYGLDGNRLSYKGYGETKPRASNKSEVGRKKNRRVDITIVTDD